MQPNHETDELSEMLEAGYAAPPLDNAFSSNLVRRMQAEVVPQAHQPRGRQARWAVMLCGVGVAASLLAIIYVSNPLRTKPPRDEVAMQSVPVKIEESKAIDSYRSLLKLESMSTTTMEEFEIVTKERAKALGLSLTSQADGPDAVRVSLEFEKQGELKEYRSAQFRQFDGDKLLLSVTLKEGESKPGRVIVGLVAARNNLATLSLDIVAMNASGSRVRYVLPMKDFVALE